MPDSVILLLPPRQSLQSSLMTARCGGVGFCLGTSWTCEFPGQSSGVTIAPKAFFADFYFTWLRKKSVARNSCLTTSVSEQVSSRMPQVELVFQGEVHGHSWAGSFRSRLLSLFPGASIRVMEDDLGSQHSVARPLKGCLFW